MKSISARRVFDISNGRDQTATFKSLLKQIQQRKQEDPDQVNKVPIQSDIL